MRRWLPFILKATIFALSVAVVIAAGAVIWVAVGGKKDNTPRTETEKVIYMAEQAVAANPNDANARIKLAAAYLDAGKTGSAVREAEIAKRLDPGDPDVNYILGLVYKKQGDYKKAAAALEKAAKTKGKLADFYMAAWYELAKTYMESKDYKKAVKAYDKALGYNPESATLLYGIAEAYERIGDKKNALAYYEEALEFVPTYQEAIAAVERLKKETSNRVKKQ